MSNYLAIATVTATMQRLLQASLQSDVPGVRVTTTRPDASGSGTPDIGVNLYLYQASPNPAWRNNDLHTRRPKGDLIKHSQAGLNLFYLMTFYGNEIELEPQRLLGSAVRTLIDQPILTQDMIEETVQHPAFSYLADSTLASQVERVTLVPSSMTTEELSKIWSVFFQTPYTLSFGYQGSTVLIEGDKPARRLLPLRGCQFYITPNQPVVDQVIPDGGSHQPITLGSSLTIRGKQLRMDQIQIRVGDARVTPQEVGETQIRLNLSGLSGAEVAGLRAGVQSLQVLHPVAKRTAFDIDRAIGSNVMAIVLCPTIREIVLVHRHLTEDDEYNGEIQVQSDLLIGKEQRVFLLLNQLTSQNPAAYIFKAKTREMDTHMVEFPIQDVQEGVYLVRIQVDRSESPLTVDTTPNSPTFEQYIGPTIEIS
ncbi:MULTISPECIES: DUF4255 domain-containing protein [unclassified Leptolyngbya]|uniref:DUF4255 domain-containing protein n=1 Tax=unclassified Leptolyngbya TaxID=2650499 RepID=UPI001683403C|nr:MULTISPECIES: DUF4255 domain-containing protein [unclassified Leptolyngbya]MBD1909749.1 DUF4255 domain-containing protein [Leptolyngbya sp. FACHB-8]MBD2157647.1 DUF4255 domain-containing protein [Leptolyngbya sp. FACHB-16]